MKNILAGYAPSAAPGDGPRIPPDKVRALDHAGENVVDYRMCLQTRGPRELARGRVDESGMSGEWVYVPGSQIRIRALCSEHPPQILSTIHLWPGCIHLPRFAPPTRSEDYQEGETLAYLIDFLADDGKTPVFRIYYQDAPTNETIGEIPEELKEEKAVDLALLCVGTFYAVEWPTHIVENTRRALYHPRPLGELLPAPGQEAEGDPLRESPTGGERRPESRPRRRGVPPGASDRVSPAPGRARSRNGGCRTRARLRRRVERSRSRSASRARSNASSLRSPSMTMASIAAETSALIA